MRLLSGMGPLEIDRLLDGADAVRDMQMAGVAVSGEGATRPASKKRASLPKTWLRGTVMPWLAWIVRA
jgi:hypothetical protein